jgi:hypothetical protein
VGSSGNKSPSSTSFRAFRYESAPVVGRAFRVEQRPAALLLRCSCRTKGSSPVRAPQNACFSGPSRSERGRFVKTGVQDLGGSASPEPRATAGIERPQIAVSAVGVRLSPSRRTGAGGFVPPDPHPRHKPPVSAGNFGYLGRDGDRSAARQTMRNACKLGLFVTIRTAGRSGAPRLKIVVSPVRVRVSPFPVLPANRQVFGVLTVSLSGAFWGHFRARGPIRGPKPPVQGPMSALFCVEGCSCEAWNWLGCAASAHVALDWA